MVTGFSLDIYDCDIVFAWDTNEKELNELLDRAEATDDDRKDFFDHIKERDLQAVTVAMGTTLIAIVFKCEPTASTFSSRESTKIPNTARRRWTDC